MILTDEEKRMLDGERGFVPRRCMEYLVDMAKVAGTDRLVDLDGTADFHVPSTAMVTHYEFPVEELKKIVDAGATFKVPTFSNKSPWFGATFVDGWENCGYPPHDDPAHHAKVMEREWMELYRRMGMITTYSCASYLAESYWPTPGQHCAWNESSAVPYCNAVLGARSNIDGSFASAFLGKAPYYGMHVTENRYATVVIDTERRIESEIEWDVLGFAVGEECRLAVPALVNTGKPTTTKYLKFNTAANTGGSIAMYHVPGSTPEAPTLEFALGGRKPQRVVVIDDAWLARTYEKLNDHRGDRVEMVSLGCPHMNLVDLMRLSRKLEGKKVKVPFWIMTVPTLYHTAEELGYRKIFEDAGARLLSGTCPAAIDGLPEGIRALAVDAAKQAYYISGLFPEADDHLDVFYGTQDDCIGAALTGVWRGEWK
ncbi:MAG: aconitase X catalytic domain-containing protein [Clostridiales Family XIII bacterium]|jgi:predicted aconitase|nr:aconitase X catalytic domain-containing protein [Clostridiales Family XIII bacterium]